MLRNRRRPMSQTVRRILPFILVLAFIFTSACAQSSKGGQSKQDVQVEIVLSENDKQAPEGLTGFSLRMGSLLYQQYEGENFVCSPISLWLPLAALLNATEGETQEALLSSLGMEGLQAAQVNEEVSQMLNDLIGESGQEDKPQLQIANIIYVNDTYNLKPEFEQVFSEVFRGAVMALDFKDKRSVNKINQWVEEKTNGEIKGIIDKLNPDAVVAILNAIYFSDQWRREFDKYQTEEDVFYAQEGESKAQYMIHKEVEQKYYEDERMQAVSLYFENGARLIVLLPKEETAGELYQSLTTEEFERITGEASYKVGTLKLPRFSIERENMKLLDLLAALQVPLLDANAGGITQLVEEDTNLYISNAMQKAMIRVDEEGTTAAAVTIIEVPENASIIEKQEPEFEMICNKPFVFLLTDSTSGGAEQILFSGVVNQP